MAITYGPKIPQLFVSAVLGEQYYAAGEAMLRGFQALIEPNVISVGLNTPPVSPANGDSYIIGGSPTGAWALQANNITYWSTDNPLAPAGEWEFYTPKNGWIVGSANVAYIFNAGAWTAVGGATALSQLSDVSVSPVSPSPVTAALGTAAPYTLLGASAVTNSDGSSTIITGGNIGDFPSGTITPGTPPWTLSGATVVTAVAQNQTDLAAAIAAYQAMGPGTSIPVALDAQVLTPGVYSSGMFTLSGGTLTLNGAGLYVFLAASTITLTGASQVVLTGGADPANVVFVCGSSFTAAANAGTVFNGNILAHTSITVNGGTYTGRLLANIGAVTISTATAIAIPPQSGIPIGDTLTFNGVFWVAAPPNVPVRVAAIPYVIDGGGSVPSTGAKGQLSIPAACTITGWTITSDVSGSAVVDVLRSTYAGFPTTSSIAGTDKPTLAAAQKNQDLVLSGWGSTAINAGDQIQFNLNSVATVTRINITLNVTIP